MSILLTGIVHVTGEHDTGKTTFALECGARAEDIAFIDSDEKGQATVQDFQEETGQAFGLYNNFIAETAGMTQLQVYDYGSSLIDQLESDRYKCIIWDAWGQRFQPTFKPYVRQNPNEFRHPKDWAGRGDIKGAQQWSESHGLEAAKLAQLQDKAPLVIITTHLKNYYIENKRVPGVQIPRASSTLERLPRLRLWLRHNPDVMSRVPIGLVLKRLDKKIETDRGLRTVCVLPRKLTPNVRLPGEDADSVPEDLSLWDTIARYMKHPFGTRAALPEETPNAFELSILNGTLTEEQKINMRLALRAASAEDETLLAENEAEAADSEAVTLAKELLAKGGKSPAQIASETGLSVPEVIKLQ